MKGLTTLELVVSLGISAPFLAALIAVSMSLHEVLDKTKKQYLDTKAAVRTTQLVHNSFNRVDSYPFRVNPRVQNSGLILFTDGTENPVMQSSRPPAVNSSSLTSISTSSSAIYKIKNLTMSTPRVEAEACLRFLVNQHDTKAKIFIGLSKNGEFELSGRSTRIIGRPRCRKFYLEHQVKSMLISSPQSSSPNSIKYLFPVSAYSTIYLDNKNQLRYLGHRGSINTENQPLSANVEEFNLNLINSINYYQLTGSIVGVKQKQYAFSFVNHLARSPRSKLLALLDNDEIN